MFRRIKMMFSSLFTKTIEKTYTDARLGKMVCEINAKEEKFFFWDVKITTINKNNETTVSVEGDINGPNPALLQMVYTLLAEIEEFKFLVQKELDSKFADQKVLLSKDYYTDDISLYLEDDLDFEIEFYSDKDNKPMVSATFKNKEITELDLY